MRAALFLAAGFALALFLSGCEQLLSGFGGTGGGSFVSGTSVTLSGQLLDWPGGTGTLYNVHSEPAEIGQTNPMTGPIQNDGSFTLTLTYPPSWNPYDYPDDCNGAVQVSDTSVGMTTLNLQVKDAQGNIVGSAQERNTPSADPAVGNKWIAYVFVEGDLSIHGTCNLGTKSEVHLDLKTGWNAVVIEITAVSTSGGVTTASAIKEYPATSEDGFHWYYDAW